MLHTNRRLLSRKGFLRDDPKDTGDPADNGGGGGGAGGDPAGGGNTDPKKPKIKGDFDPDRMTADLGKARDDAKTAKAAQQAAEKAKTDLIDTIAVALGLKPDPNTDPATIAATAAKELTNVRDENRGLKIENAVLKLAGKAGGDPDALLDSTSFLKVAAGLDPSAADFKEKFVAAIKDAVKDNARLAAKATAGQTGRMGADMSGGNTTGDRPKSLREAFARQNR